MEREKRLSNIEALRILAMLLIVMSHFSTHGSWPALIGANGAILNVMSSFGNIGVDIFILISGYFLVSMPFKTKSLTKVVLPTAFWQVALGGGGASDALA